MDSSLIKIILLCSIVTQVLCSHKWSDYMGKHEKQKLVWLSEDLYKDAMLKLRQVFAIRQEHEKYIAYHVGMIMGRVREKYRFMVEIYRDIYDKTNNRSALMPPGVKHYKSLHYIIALEMIHYLSVEIDKLLNVIEDTAMDDIRSSNIMIARPIDTKGNGTRMGPERPEDAALRAKAKEEATKSILRQKYLMKKIGRPLNLTTSKKRFRKQWPVEDTWSLEKYNYK
ncbi:uncharacterized protein LOC124644370 [Helicoverpa zea]|uniref:uncharacterized protein LOC124644370 n=1 Tax=Helicoverpa zea TaxID=7113 RepID=UPI001F592420|nr:uncharacterized protein LOC124644370 [Helicoverpa zea]